MDEKRPDDYIEIKIPEEEPAQPTRTKEPATPKTEAPKPAQKKTRSPAAKKTVKKKKQVKRKATRKPITPVTKKKVVVKKRAQVKREAVPPASNWFWVIALIIGLVIIAGVVLNTLPKPNETTQTNETENQTTVAALVNNVPIYDTDVQKIFERLPANMQNADIKNQVLQQLIDEELLIEEAARKGITVSDEEVTRYRQDILDLYGMNDEQLTQALLSQGSNDEEFNKVAIKNIKYDKLLNETVYQYVNVTDDEISTHYDENIDQFSVPATATVRHILITGTENTSEEEVKNAAEAILTTTTPENFCTYVSNYSADGASVPNCGEYQVSQDGTFVQEFEEAAFNLSIGEMKLVKTTFGYHIIWKINMTEEKTSSLDEVSDQIKDFLVQEKINLGVRKYLAGLRDAARVELYPTNTAPVMTEPAAAEDEKQLDNEMQTTVVETQPVRDSSFVECLRQAQTTLYGVYWSPDTQEQKELLGNMFDEINYVECDPDGPNAQPELCTDIAVFPTWVIGDETIIGKQSQAALSTITGCMR